MYARLFAKSGKMAGKSYEITTEAVIGHGPECNILIKSGVLSAKHARIFYDQKKAAYFLEDFRTFNGTLLDGKPVQGKVKLEKKHVLMFANTFAFIFQIEQGQAADPLPPPPKDLPPEPEPPPRKKQSEPPAGAGSPVPAPPAPAPPIAASGGDAFGIGAPPFAHHTVFDDVPPPEPHEAEFIGDLPVPEPVPQSRDAAPTMLIDEAQLAELLHPPPRFLLEFKNVRGEKHTIELKEGENTVGRLSASTVAVDDASISRNHALIIVRAGKLTLKDLDSKNGTFVADKKVTGEAAVEPDAPLRFGLVKATIVRKPEKPA